MASMIETLNQNINWSLLIAGAAFIIAFLNHIRLNKYQKEQNKKWDYLNLAKIELLESKFFGWEEMSIQESKSRNWGYQPTLFKIVKEDIITDKVYVIDPLILWNEQDNMVIENSHFKMVNEANTIAQGLKLDIKDLSIRKNLRTKLKFKNVGQTEAIEFSIGVRFFNWNTEEWQPIHETPPIDILHAASNRYQSFDIYIPLEWEIPQEIRFQVDMTYKSVNNQVTERTINLEYHKNNNTWGFTG